MIWSVVLNRHIILLWASSYKDFIYSNRILNFYQNENYKFIKIESNVKLPAIQKTMARSNMFSDLNLVMRKRVFGVCDQVSPKPACSGTEASWRHEISDIATRSIRLSRQRITKTDQTERLICVFVVRIGQNRFSPDAAHLSSKDSLNYIFPWRVKSNNNGSDFINNILQH